MIERVRAILSAYQDTPGALLPALHAIQDSLGYVPPETVPTIADAMNLSRAEVHGVITFYHHFRSKPPAAHVIQVCRAEACQSMGVEGLIAHAEQRLGCRMNEATADGQFALEPVYCLGHCAASPALMINDDVHARVTSDKLDRLIDQAKEAA